MLIRITIYSLALIFTLSGGAKLLSLPFEIEAFERWGYSSIFMYTIGVLEVIGAIGLLAPRVSALASFCLTVLMLGAITTHLIHGEWPMLVVASAIAFAAGWRGWSGRADIKKLVDAFR
ncbi:DoxX family protein [Microbulbifer agarilyticus]|uniref:DoxX family protein n=1 Tax=Microbulbifer agarilyticus TaxID=260552 RepID=UPI001CD521B4|nr:DoxX family protein [Microbulbifer agarilyticus]MCA0895019.1 DoxX family protein [Microbulbifer agarilyticus]